MREYENTWKYITDADYEEAEANGIKKNTVRNRVCNLNWPVSRAIREKPRNLSFFTDEEKDLMKKHGLTYEVVYSRKKAGWPPEKWFAPKGRKAWLDINLVEKAKANGISYELLYWRKKQCWSDEEATTRKPSRINKHIRKRGLESGR